MNAFAGPNVNVSQQRGTTAGCPTWRSRGLMRGNDARPMQPSEGTGWHRFCWKCCGAVLSVGNALLSTTQTHSQKALLHARPVQPLHAQGRDAPQPHRDVADDHVQLGRRQAGRLPRELSRRPRCRRLRPRVRRANGHHPRRPHHDVVRRHLERRADRGPRPRHRHHRAHGRRASHPARSYRPQGQRASAASRHQFRGHLEAAPAGAPGRLDLRRAVRDPLWRRRPHLSGPAIDRRADQGSAQSLCRRCRACARGRL